MHTEWLNFHFKIPKYSSNMYSISLNIGRPIKIFDKYAVSSKKRKHNMSIIYMSNSYFYYDNS
jgi:hypothetical protein